MLRDEEKILSYQKLNFFRNFENLNFFEMPFGWFRRQSVSDRKPSLHTDLVNGKVLFSKFREKLL